MRYTLRLLTLQQFERAAGLICALGDRAPEDLPDTAPISLGLWVGQGATPNNVKDARERRSSGRDGPAARTPTTRRRPRPAAAVPLVRHALDHLDYEVVDSDRMRVGVRQRRLRVPRRPAGAPRRRGRLRRAPVAGHRHRRQVRDDAVSVRSARCSVPGSGVRRRRRLPAARPDRAGRAAPDQRPPGHDGRSVRDRRRRGSARSSAPAKVVASTATIRRASDRCGGLRPEARQFPPPGLDPRDSYFAVEAPRRRRAAASTSASWHPASSQTTLMVRAYAALLQAASDRPGRTRSATPTGRCSATSTACASSVAPTCRSSTTCRTAEGRRRPARHDAARARRASGADLAQEVHARSRTSSQILEHAVPGRRAPDVVLATNMISVGVDVDRLGLMAVMGQPQTTAEYIQATSRVGRRIPGLVVVDLQRRAIAATCRTTRTSRAYHRALYRQVEATGATPFAATGAGPGPPRLSSLHWLGTASRGAAERAAGDARLGWRARRARRRSIAASGASPPGVGRRRRRRRVAELIREAAGGPHRRLGRRLHLTALQVRRLATRHRGALLVRRRASSARTNRGRLPVDDPPWPTLTSLRDVDAESGLTWSDEEEEPP